jgi:hypothetical protein
MAYNIVVSSCVYNEEGHIASGLIHWHAGDFAAFRVNPPLPRMAATLPLAFVDSKEIAPCSVPLLIRQRIEYAAGRRLVETSADRWLCHLRTARIPSAMLALAGSLLCYCWATQCYGGFAGIVAAALWATCPYVLGHGCLVGADVAAATAGAAAVYCFWKWLKSPLALEMVIAGVAIGLAELCKFTLLVLYPMLPLLWLMYRLPERRTLAWRDWLRQEGMLTGIVLISLGTLNGGYLFEDTFTPLENFRFQTMMFTGCASLDDVPLEGANRFDGTWWGKLPVPLPANMVQGIDTQRFDFEHGLASYLRGQWSDHGWWHYYLYALAVKLPLGTWCLVLLAVGMSVFGPRSSASWRDELAMLAPLAAILAFVSSQTGFSIHSRYAIPALPFLFVWISKVAGGRAIRTFTRTRAAFAALVVTALTCSIGSSLAAYPHSLSYFNELVGGPRHGGEHLLDSNLDWGQDLLYLKDWFDEHPTVTLDGLACWGSCPGTVVGIPETPFPPPGPDAEDGNSRLPDDQLGPKPGWYALSINHLYGRDRRYQYLLHLEPVAMAGYSIYIYHVTVEEANRARRDFGLPELRDFESREAETGCKKIRVEYLRRNP